VKLGRLPGNPGEVATLAIDGKALISFRGHQFMTSARRGSGSGSGGREEGPAPCARPRKNLDPTDIILFSSRAKKLAFFTTISSLDGIKSGNLSSI